MSNTRMQIHPQPSSLLALFPSWGDHWPKAFCFLLGTLLPRSMLICQRWHVLLWQGRGAETFML